MRAATSVCDSPAARRAPASSSITRRRRWAISRKPGSTRQPSRSSIAVTLYPKSYKSRRRHSEAGFTVSPYAGQGIIGGVPDAVTSPLPEPVPDAVAEHVPARPRGTGRSPVTQRHGRALVVAALGVVFGDIGTSPLYSLQTVFSLDHNKVQATPTTCTG